MTSQNTRFVYALIATLLVVSVAALSGQVWVHNTPPGSMVEQFVAGDRVANFQIQQVNPTNVTGLIYIMYPVATVNGEETTIHINDTVGYACDGTLARLVGISGNTALFEVNITTKTDMCPV